MFHLDVVCVSSGCGICCNDNTVMLQVHVLKCFSCFKRMLQVFYLDVTYVAMAIHICCKCMFRMFQLFQTYVVGVLSRCCICCTGYTRMLQVYV